MLKKIRACPKSTSLKKNRRNLDMSEKIRQNLDKFRTKLDKFRTPRFTDGVCPDSESV
jgi:hypothetical protein